MEKRDKKPAKGENELVFLGPPPHREPLFLQDNELVYKGFRPPLDPLFMKWYTREFDSMHRFTVKKPRSIEPPDHVVEYMRLFGMLDPDLDDPDLAHLIK
ncbi:hypothetical protein Droror1_Dr00004144 [Drosera rotundifolia]